MPKSRCMPLFLKVLHFCLNFNKLGRRQFFSGAASFKKVVLKLNNNIDISSFCRSCISLKHMWILLSTTVSRSMITTGQIVSDQLTITSVVAWGPFGLDGNDVDISCCQISFLLSSVNGYIGKDATQESGIHVYRTPVIIMSTVYTHYLHLKYNSPEKNILIRNVSILVNIEIQLRSLIVLSYCYI